MDSAPKQATEPAEAPWRPRKAAGQGTAYAVFVGYGIAALVVFWAQYNHREPFGDWDRAFYLFGSFIAGMSFWGTTMGFFCAKLPHRFGAGVRFLWALAGCVPVFLILYFYMAFADRSPNSREHAIIVAASGAALGFVFALIGQFTKRRPARPVPPPLFPEP